MMITTGKLFQACKSLNKYPLTIRVVMASEILSALNIPPDKIDIIKQNIIKKRGN